jgi:hypothetical protein
VAPKSPFALLRASAVSLSAPGEHTRVLPGIGQGAPREHKWAIWVLPPTPPGYPYPYLPLYLSGYLPAYLYFYLPGYLYIYLPVYLYLYLCGYL